MTDAVKAKPPLIEIRNKKGHEDKLTHGAITEVLVDGERLKAVKEVRVRITAREMAEVTVVMYGRVKANVLGNLHKEIIDPARESTEEMMDRHQEVADEMSSILKEMRKK